MTQKHIAKPYAQVTWLIDDLTEEFGLTNHQAAEVLETYESNIQEAMIQSGWDVIRTFVSQFKSENESVANPTGPNYQP